MTKAAQSALPGHPAGGTTVRPEPQRCAWCTADPLYIAYHDAEWGIPSHDDRHL
ncbi:MAG: DNA-3-methyladenine glycosylase I, partial [Casimicrobiaceae bacterium]